jgi:competence protein ComEA
VVASTAPVGSGTVEGATALVNLNSATAEELETLPGIGEVLAATIVQYREEHGPFTSVDQLVDVSGIGEVTLEELRDLVTV